MKTPEYGAMRTCKDLLALNHTPECSQVEDFVSNGTPNLKQVTAEEGKKNHQSGATVAWKALQDPVDDNHHLKKQNYVIRTSICVHPEIRSQ